MAPGLEAKGEGARVGGLLVPGASPQCPGGTRRGASRGGRHVGLWHLWGRGQALGESLHHGWKCPHPQDTPAPCLTSSNLRAL